MKKEYIKYIKNTLKKYDDDYDEDDYYNEEE